MGRRKSGGMSYRAGVDGSGGVRFGVGLLAYSVRANVELFFGVLGVSVPLMCGTPSILHTAEDETNAGIL